jgi:hypothetical protein
LSYEENTKSLSSVEDDKDENLENLPTTERMMEFARELAEEQRMERRNNGQGFLFDELVNAFDSIPLQMRFKKLPQLKDIDSLLLFHILEHLSFQNPNGFFMFYSPQRNQLDYKKGQSLTEMLEMSVQQLKLCFAKFGARFSSIEEYEAAKEQVNNKYYFSIYDKKRNGAYFFRNHRLVKEEVNKILGEPEMPDFYLGIECEASARGQKLTREQFKEFKNQKADSENPFQNEPNYDQILATNTKNELLKILKSLEVE